MPTLKRLCTGAGCTQLATKGAYCEHCKAKSRERKAERDRERPSPQERGYDLTWRRTRGRYLKAHPRCETCGKRATEVDHIIPISQGGDRLKWHNLQSQCKPCHSRKTINEFRGEHGMVTNQWTGQEEKDDWHELMYVTLPKPNYPVTLVAGPPGAGKTTYVKEHAQKGDVMCDLDMFRPGAASLREAVADRNRELRSLTECQRLWFIAMAPEPWERRHWSDTLGADVLLIMPGLETCLMRIQGDGRDVEGRMKGAHSWFRRYQPWERDNLK